MIKLQYVASSGNIYDLNSNGILTREANFHSWAWQASGVALQYGQRLVQFTRDAVTYTADLVLKGPKPQRQAILEALHEDMERDVRLQTPGRLIWQSWYIPCYAVESTTEPQANRTDNTVGFFCPRPFWVRERAVHFEKSKDEYSYQPIYAPEEIAFSVGGTTNGVDKLHTVYDILEQTRIGANFEIEIETLGTYQVQLLAGDPGTLPKFVKSADTDGDSVYTLEADDGTVLRLYRGRRAPSQPKTSIFTYAKGSVSGIQMLGVTFSIQVRDLPTDFLDYPIEYDYDFYKGANGAETIARDFPFAADFKMDIFGPAASPAVYINGHEYGIDYTIDAGAYATIDSRNNTVILTQADTTKTNIFDYRKKDSNVFAEIPGGTLSVIWSGEFGFDLTIFEERSEPTW